MLCPPPSPSITYMYFVYFTLLFSQPPLYSSHYSLCTQGWKAIIEGFDCSWGNAFIWTSSVDCLWSLLTVFQKPHQLLIWGFVAWIPTLAVLQEMMRSTYFVIRFRKVNFMRFFNCACVCGDLIRSWCLVKLPAYSVLNPPARRA